MQLRGRDGFLPVDAGRQVGVNVNSGPSVRPSKNEGARPKDTPRESYGRPLKKTAGLADGAGKSRPRVQTGRAFFRENGRPSKKWRRKSNAARERRPFVQKQVGNDADATGNCHPPVQDRPGARRKMAPERHAGRPRARSGSPPKGRRPRKAPGEY